MATMTTPAPESPAFHVLSIPEALEREQVDQQRGLGSDEVASRRQKYGPNKFAEAPKEPRWRAFLRQYTDPMQIVLLVACFSGLLSNVINVVFNAVEGGVLNLFLLIAGPA